MTEHHNQLGLFDLLSFDPSGLSQEKIKEVFDMIAEEILNKYCLNIQGRKHRIIEIEFYLTTDNHNDEYSHCDEMQKSFKKWYFHKNGQTFKSGTYKGIDITFSSVGYGGILIRGLEDLESGEIIDGPSLTVDRILKLCSANSIQDFVNEFNLCIENKSKLYLSEIDLDKRQVYTSGRVGLTLKKHNANRIQFVGKFYRYLSLPARTKKGKPYLISALYAQSFSQDKIIEISKSPKKTVESYISHYVKGKSANIKYFYGLTLSSQLICQLYGCLSEL